MTRARTDTDRAVDRRDSQRRRNRAYAARVAAVAAVLADADRLYAERYAVEIDRS